MSRLSEWKDQAQDASAPEGQKQVAQAGIGVSTEDPRYSQSKLGQWMQDADTDYADVSQRWYTGANSEGTNNGWDNDFNDRFFKGQAAAAKKGRLATYFEDGGTGVVTWDHQAADGREFKFGDIYDDGNLVGNVYDLYDRNTANLRMGALLFDGKEQARIFGDSDRERRLDREVEAKRVANNEDVPKALTAADFAVKAGKTQDELDEGYGSEIAAVAAGTASGALMGAGFGAPGAIIGAVAGGLGALLNQDEIEQRTARGIEIVKQNAEENNSVSAFFTGVQQAGDVALLVGSPVQNLVKGAEDAFLSGQKAMLADGTVHELGGIGDDESGFYAVDKTGKRLAGYLSQGLALGGAVVDGVLQFGSPQARALYSAEIGAHIIGATGEILTNGFEQFNPRSGTYDPLFLDDEGNFDPISGAAGILNIGVDAIQLGGLRGLANTTRATNEAIGAGRAVDEGAGFRFTLDPVTGRATSKKASLAILAPSEQVAAFSAARAARVRAVNEGRAVSADDFYQATQQLANGDKRLKAAIMNGIGEGYEELVQALLEPISMDGDLSFQEIAESFLYGTAGGVGMSVGAVRGAAAQDDRLYNRAVIIQRSKFGTELTRDEWRALDPTEKRIRSTFSATDQEATQKALQLIRREQAAERLASEPDMAKAMDARRTVIEKELQTATERSDSYTVISGIVDQGVVSELGNRLGDTRRAEAVEGSVLKVIHLLEDRLKGIRIQLQYLTEREADLLTQDQTNQDVIDQLQEVRELRVNANNAVIVGTSIVEEAQTMGQYIYDQSTTEAQAAQGVRDLNKALEQYFDRSIRLSAEQLKGWKMRAGDAKDAAAMFVSLLSSREPKLDTGSYHSFLPQASWELTRTRSDNFLQINMDYLQAINGDFDGDKLRAENQLILTKSQWLASRSGAHFGGAGNSIDVATRHFDQAMVDAIAAALTSANDDLRDAAIATMAAIETAIQHRYGALMSIRDMNNVLAQFGRAVRAGNEDARVELLNGMARAASQEITNQGEATLTNEWLWMSKIVRANFQQFQRSYWKLNQSQAADAGPTPTEDVSQEPTPRGTQVLKMEAVNDAQTLALFVPGNSLFRKFQSIHYTFFNSSVLSATGSEDVQLEEIAAIYAELSRGVTQSELSRVTSENSTAARAMVMLDRLVQSALSDPDMQGKLDPSTAAAVLANVKVKDVWWDAGRPVQGTETLSLAQVLLRLALDAEREEFAKSFPTDEKMQARHARLRAMTRPSKDGEVNAEKAYIELFKASPFGDALGHVTGNLSAQVTPEQWIATYMGKDPVGRAEYARTYTSHPSYLKRKETTNIPYSMSEMGDRKISPYRSMLDAMVAVGNASISMDANAADPAEVLRGDLVRPSKAAAEDFMTAFELIRESVLDYRKLLGRHRRTRGTTADLVQELMQTYPDQGRQLLSLIPDASANALFEYRDGKLYISNWLYDMFALDNPEEALMMYWRNLTLSQWNATQQSLHEDDGAGASGRNYNRLQSRFQRLMYELAQEPGQANLELLIRKMTDSTNLDEFFRWVNTAPGIRNNRVSGDHGGRAPLVPFNDDVAAFEADQAGGWVTSRASGDLREAIGKLRQGAEQLRDAVKFRNESDEMNSTLARSIRRALDNTTDATPDDREQLRRLREALKLSTELPRGFSPRAMVTLTRGAVNGFDAHSTDKAVAPTSYGPIGEATWLMDAFGYLPNNEQLQEALTVHNIDSLSTDLGNTLRTSGQAMDEWGQTIEWNAVDPANDDHIRNLLDMIDDVEAQPLALLQMTPAALDVYEGRLSERVLFQPSLRNILNQSGFEDLFAYDDDDELSYQRDLKYLMVLGARARMSGADFDVINIANDLAITMLSKLDRRATLEDRERATQRAYRQIASTLRIVGAIQANPDTRDSGVLDQLQTSAVELMQTQRVGRVFSDMQGLTRTAIESWIEGVLAQYTAQEGEAIAAATGTYTGPELDRQIEAIQRQFAINRQRISNLLNNDIATDLMTRFHVTGDARVDGPARFQIQEYVRLMSDFPTRAPEAATAWSKLMRQLDTGTIDLKNSEWEALSRGAMGVHLADQLIGVASHISLAPFASGDPIESASPVFKYQDPSFSWVARDLLSSTSALTEAAVWLHTAGKQSTLPIKLDDALQQLNKTILRPQNFGEWTPGLRDQLIATRERMMSAAGGAGVGAPGNGQKRWALLAGATLRTANTAGLDALLTTATLKGSLFVDGVDPFAEFAVTPQGSTAAQTMPLAQLNNRFVSAIRVNGQPISLNTSNLGFEWRPNLTALRYITVARLRPVLARHARIQGVALADLDIEIDFLHPDSMPAAEEWAHSAWFEGMDGGQTPDIADSLIASFWAGNGGKISQDTQFLIDAGKRGLNARSRFRGPNAARLLDAHNAWLVENDFAKMLRIKTELWITTRQSDGEISPESYNAIYKMLKLQHTVTGYTPDDEPVVLTADQVIASQLANPGGPLIAEINGQPVEVTGTELKVLSMDVLRSMVGDISTQGVPRFSDEDFLLNPLEIPQYTRVTESMMARFANGWFADTGRLQNTRLAHVGHQRVLGVSVMATPAEKDAAREAVERRDRRREGVVRKRAESNTSIRQGYKAGLNTILQTAWNLIEGDRASFEFSSLGIDIIAPRSQAEIQYSQHLVNLLRQSDSADGTQRGFQIVDEGNSDYLGGRLTLDSLFDSGRKEEDELVAGDYALVQLATFDNKTRDPEQVTQRIQKALAYLVTTDATIVLASGDGRADTRTEAARYLKSRGYEPLRGSKHIFIPSDSSAQTQNQKAYESTFLETRLITPNRNIVSFVAIDPIGGDEGLAAHNPNSTKLRDRKAISNLLPGFPGFNLPVEDGQDLGLYQRTLEHLRTMTDPANTEARAALLQMGGTDLPRVKSLDQALNDFFTKINSRSSILPQAGDTIEEGDIIPFLHANGSIVLYRHGMKLPKVTALPTLLATNGMNIALARSESEPLANRNTGTVRSVTNEAGYTRQLVIEALLQTYGDKVQLDWNGLKVTLVPMPEQLQDVPMRIGRNGLEADMWVDRESADSKEAFYGRVTNYRNALTFFQFDFLEDMVDFFFPNSTDRSAHRVATFQILDTLAKQETVKIPFSTATAISRAGVAIGDMLAEFAGAAATVHGSDPNWHTRLQATTTANAQIAQAVITYLLTPQANVENILRSGGFFSQAAMTDEGKARAVPGLFADLLSSFGYDSPLHEEMIRRWDSQLVRNADGSGLRLHKNWEVEVFSRPDSKGDKTPIRVYLQFGEAHSSGDNPVTDGQAYGINERGTVSHHNAYAAAMSVGAITPHRNLIKSQEFARSYTREGSLTKLSDDMANVWEMLSSIPNRDSGHVGWKRETAAEATRRFYAREEIAGLFVKLDMSGWSADSKLKYRSFMNAAFGELHLYGVQKVVFDAWVRQRAGRPHGVREDGTVEPASIISERDALNFAQEILAEVRAGNLPVVKGKIPLLDNNHLAMIYLANASRANGWAPRVGTSENSARATTWDEWVEVAFGTAWGEDFDPQFDSVYLLAVDGLMHGYQGANDATRMLPVSSDVLRNNQLMDPENSRMLISISADANQLATEPAVFNSSRATLEGILVGERIYADVRGEADPSSADGRQKKRLDRWRREEEAPDPLHKRARGVRGAGQSFIGHSTTTNAFWRSFLNLRVGNAMFNAALILMAPVDAFWRRTINTIANVAVGESTGALGAKQARLAERFADTRIGAVAAELGLLPTYSSEELLRLNRVINALATRSDFKSMIYKELMYQYPSMPGIGRVEKALEKWAKSTGRFQDPAWGMLPNDLARIYVETALRRISTDPTGENIYSVGHLLLNMERNPEWLSQEDLETHNMAINAIANVRSLKATVFSLGMRGLIEPLSENPKFLFNSTGNFLKVMTAFQNFWSNYAVNLTGMQGPADFVAFLIDGREKKLGRRMQRALRGKDLTAPDETEHYDMSEVLEGLDLADSFIRGGITHTALFTFGLMAGGLGLSGEDDEEKWRRRAAELQGAGFVHDPRKLQNDFAMRDAIYLDWLPPGLGAMFRVPEGEVGEGRQVAQMNWLLRSILSPVIGFERFYETGNFMEVIHGFKDAIGAHPIMNQQLWSAAMDTVAELQSQALTASEKGTDEGNAESAHLLITAVGVLERMAFENSMINMMYIGRDRYDRNPYALEQPINSEQDQVDVRGNRTPADTLKEYTDEDGETKVAYVTRDDAGAQFRALTENRFTLALLGSLFSGVTGGGFTGSTYFRENMVPKLRQFELTSADDQDIEAALLAAFRAAAATEGNVPNFSEDEIASKLRADYKAAGIRYDNAEVEARAAQLAKQQGAPPMSFINAEGREEPTIAGGKATFAALASGAIDFDSPALNGFFLSFEKRQELQDKWMKDLVDEGLELGLDKKTATFRMKRLWFGPIDDSQTPGLFDVVFSDKIPYSDKLEYNQLNVTYMTGPDGFPRATPFTRDGILGAFGLNPLMRPWNEKDTGLELDDRLNTVDTPAGVNTGMRALERRGDSWEIPMPIEEIRAAAEKVADTIGEAANGESDGTGFASGGYGGGYSFGGGGYNGGGGSYTPHINFIKMQPLSLQRAIYGHELQFINTSNPIIRRANIRRERISSDRSRLKQWQ